MCVLPIWLFATDMPITIYKSYWKFLCRRGLSNFTKGWQEIIRQSTGAGGNRLFSAKKDPNRIDGSAMKYKVRAGRASPVTQGRDGRRPGDDFFSGGTGSDTQYAVSSTSNWSQD